MAAQPKLIYEFGRFRLIPTERQLLRDDQPVPLTPKTFDLLVVLVENSGHLTEKDELLKRIWPDSFVEEANLSVNMSALRRALGEGPEDHQYVETVPRHGYRFVAKVRETWENGAANAAGAASESSNTERVVNLQTQPSSVIPAAAPRSRMALRRWSFVFVGLLLLVVAVVILNAGGLRDRLFSNHSPTRVQSLAVLPLRNVSGDAAQNYLADGITDGFINDLAKIETLRVMSRASVIRYKDALNSPGEIGRDLKVDAVLAGSVARTGDRVRATLQLIHVPTGRSLWVADYDRELRDVPKLQGEVRRDIAEKIGLKTPPRQDKANVPSVNAEAYDHYLRGQFYLYRQTREDNEAAIAALEQAVVSEPNFAAAYADLAQAYVWKIFLFKPGEKQLEEKAFVAVEKALALDPDAAVAYLARGRLLWTPANHFPHDRAIMEYRKALSLNPSLDEARNQLALVYCHIGAFAEALQESQLALATNPNNNLAQFRIAQTLNFQGKYDEALSALRTIRPDANPALVGHQMAWALFNLGRKEDALALLEQLLKDHPEDTGGVFTSIQAVLAASAGQERLAEDKIKSAIEKGKGFGHFHHTAYQIACAYALMNKPELAIKWLETAAEDGFPCYPLFERDTNLDNLRQDARFIAFLAKQKQQWEHYRTIL
jgi:TolB-like protein/DNA-binding winged helix-turn-helix (wHTH) protein/lipopolysaccharide biosynthesis regulator YciM